MDLALLSILALGILIVCIVSYPDKFVPKSIENMNTEEIITDFELLLQFLYLPLVCFLNKCVM